MFRRLTIAAVLAAATLALSPPAALAESFQPGADGAGDPYFPKSGNGGYDVQHYLLDVGYVPATDVLTGTATITARATQNLSSFNLDLQGLTVREITVNGRPANWSRAGTELTVTPRSGLRKDRVFVAKVRYDGIPQAPAGSLIPGNSGFMPTADGATVAGQPFVAATWYPVNDHPSDKAAYTFIVKVPAGLEAIANGELIGNWTRGGMSTWVWNAPNPMASYLVTATMGDYDLRTYRENGIKFVDAVATVRAAYRRPVRFLGEGRQLVQAVDPHHRRAASGRAAVVLGRPEHRVPVRLRLRRGPHRRCRRLDHAARPQRPHLRRHRLRLPVLARRSPVPGPLPDRSG